jgi:hypothetical protein
MDPCPEGRGGDLEGSTMRLHRIVTLVLAAHISAGSPRCGLVPRAVAQTEVTPAKTDTVSPNSDGGTGRTRSVGSVKPKPLAQAEWPIPGLNRVVGIHQADTTDSTLTPVFFVRPLWALVERSEPLPGYRRRDRTRRR